MKTITNSEFLANPELYLGMALEQDVRVRQGDQMIRMFLESSGDEDDDEPIDEKTWEAIGKFFDEMEPNGPPPMLSDEEEIANSITFDELMVGIQEDIHRKWAQRRV